MAVNEPIDPRVRLAIAQWPQDAPRGAVSTFCAEHGISRKSFYELRKRAQVDGPTAVLEPKGLPRRVTPQVAWDATRPAPGIRYVGNGRPPGPRPKNPGVSPKP